MEKKLSRHIPNLESLKLPEALETTIRRLHTNLYDLRDKVIDIEVTAGEGPPGEPGNPGAPGTPGPPGPPEDPPPDVAVSGITVAGRMTSHNTGALFGGTIHYPTGHADYAKLKRVELGWQRPVAGSSPPAVEFFLIARFGRPQAPATSITFTGLWDDRILLGKTAVSGGALVFIAIAEGGTNGLIPAVAPVTLPGMIAHSVNGFEENVNRWQTKDNRQVHSVVELVVVGVPGVPFLVTIWTNHPPGSPNGERLWHGWFEVNGDTQIFLGKEGTNTELYTPLVDETWTATVEVGAIESVDPPSAAAISGPITGDGPSGKVAQTGAPPAGLIPDIIIPPGAGGTFPYDVQLADGSHQWLLEYVRADTTAVFDSTNTWTVQLTTHDFDGDDNFVFGPEHPYVDKPPIKGVQHFGDLLGPYGDNGAGFFIKAYVLNRVTPAPGLKPWEDPAVATFQCQRKVVVAVGGATPPGLPPDAMEKPGTPTIGTISYRWVPNTELGAHETCAFELLVPVTPPSPLGVYAGVHVYLEVPDGSAHVNFIFHLGGGRLGTDRAASVWRPIDNGQYPYDGQPSQLLRPRVSNVPVLTGSTMDVRVIVVPFSASYDPHPTRAGLPGAAPSWVIEIAPPEQDKPNSGANITPFKVTSLTASAGAPQLVNNRMQTPVSVTVDLSTVPIPQPTGWGYRLWAYVNGDITSAPVFVSPVLQAGGVIPSNGIDGISGPHTFGVITPATVTSVTIYAVAGLLAPDGVTFQANNILVSLTASATVSLGALVSGIGIAEVFGSRNQRPPGGDTYVTVRMTITQIGATTVTAWFSFNDGATYRWEGAQPFTNGSYIDIEIRIPQGASTVRAKAAAGSYPPESAPPPGAPVSNPIPISLGVPSATSSPLTITNAAGLPPTKQNIFMGYAQSGPWARVDCTIQTPGNADTNTAFYQWWVLWCDAAGNPMNPGDVLNSGKWGSFARPNNDGKLQHSHLDFDYPSVDNTYLEFRVYAHSQNSAGSTPPFTGDSAAVQWPSGLTYYRLPVGLPPGADQVTNPGGGQNSNPTVSMLANWSFLYNAPGFYTQLGVRSGAGFLNGWASFTGMTSSIECRNDGGNSGQDYVRLTGPSTSIYQTVSIVAGAKLYFSIALRSSNHTTGHNIGINIDWMDANHAAIGSPSIIGTALTFLSAWNAKAITGYATPPPNAAFANVRVTTGASEPGYWDVDDVVMQAVLSQTTGGGTAEVITGDDGSGNTGVFRAQGVAQGAVYGQNYLKFVGGPYGHEGFFSNEFFYLIADSNNDFVIQNQSGIGIVILQRIGGTLFTGYTGTVQGAHTANRPVKNGIIC